MPLRLCKEYLNVYEGIQSEIVNTMRFNENSDLSMTYLGRSSRARNDNLIAGVFFFQFHNMGIHQVNYWMEQNVSYY